MLPASADRRTPAWADAIHAVAVAATAAAAITTTIPILRRIWTESRGYAGIDSARRIRCATGAGMRTSSPSRLR